MNKLVRFFRLLGDLKLTLVCLVLAMCLVYTGTIAQVHLGTYAAQKAYFNSWLVWSNVAGTRIPIFPGGLTVGALWLINLVCAFVFHFRYVRQKSGLLVSHAGLILLVLGQFLTQTRAHESQMPIEVGHSRQYSENPREMELAFTSSIDNDTDEITRVPLSRFNKPGLIETPTLPFKIHILRFFENAELGMGASAEKNPATQGIGTRVSIKEIPPTATEEDANNVSVFMEILDANKNFGVWLVSAGLGAPQSVNVNGRDYSFAIRPRRNYLPFEIQLKEFKHDIYPGTDIPKNFSSAIHLTNFKTGENRDALIYMNHPLRYDGKTFYQASFGEGDRVSIFQVVENPAWLTPYVACAMVILGLAFHFLMQLIRFSKRPS